MKTKYKNITSLSKALKVIAEQDRMIGELTRHTNDLEDTERRRQDWKRKAKQDAGYDTRISFDIVWQEILALAQSKR